MRMHNLLAIAASIPEESLEIEGEFMTAQDMVDAKYSECHCLAVLALIMCLR